MNKNAFRKALVRHARKNVDWTGKRRISITVAVRVDSITTPRHRQILSRVRDYVEANKCPVVTLSRDERYLLLCSSSSYTYKGDALWLTGYAGIYYRLLRGSGMVFRIRPTHCIDQMPDFNKPVLNQDRLDDAEYMKQRATEYDAYQAQCDAWQQKADTYFVTL